MKNHSGGPWHFQKTFDIEESCLIRWSNNVSTGRFQDDIFYLEWKYIHLEKKQISNVTQPSAWQTYCINFHCLNFQHLEPSCWKLLLSPCLKRQLKKRKSQCSKSKLTGVLASYPLTSCIFIHTIVYQEKGGCPNVRHFLHTTATKCLCSNVSVTFVFTVL